MSRFVKFSAVLVVGLAVAFLCSGVLFSQDAVTVINMVGAPKILKSGQADWTVCTLKMTVGTGDRIQTGAGEYIELSFLSKKLNVTRIEPESDVVVKLGAAPYTIELMKGSMMALLESLPKGSQFLVKTPIAIAGVRGSGIGVSLISNDKGAFERIAAFEHQIDVSGNGTPIAVTVSQGYGLTITTTDINPKATPLSDSEVKSWNDWVPPQHQLTGGETGGADATRGRLDAASDRAEQNADILEDRREAAQEADDVNRIAERQADRQTERRYGDDGGYNTGK